MHRLGQALTRSLACGPESLAPPEVCVWGGVGGFQWSQWAPIPRERPPSTTGRGECEFTASLHTSKGRLSPCEVWVWSTPRHVYRAAQTQGRDNTAPRGTSGVKPRRRPVPPCARGQRPVGTLAACIPRHTSWSGKTAGRPQTGTGPVAARGRPWGGLSTKKTMGQPRTPPSTTTKIIGTDKSTHIDLTPSFMVKASRGRSSRRGPQSRCGSSRARRSAEECTTPPRRRRT